jgi:hypothetical protein
MLCKRILYNIKINGLLYIFIYKSIYLEQLNIENESSSRWNEAWISLFAISVSDRDEKKEKDYNLLLCLITSHDTLTHMLLLVRAGDLGTRA